MSEQILSIIIPVYNEEATLDELLQNVWSQPLPFPQWKKDIMVIIDDQCTDDSYSVALRRAQMHPEIRVIAHGKKGKGAAIKTGLLLAKGNILMIQDSDLEYSTQDYPELLKPLVSENKSFVLGHRCPQNKQTWRIRSTQSFGLVNWCMDIAGYFFNQLVNLLFGKRILDQACMFKVFNKQVLEGIQLESDGFSLEIEMLGKLFKKGVSPVQVPVQYTPRSFKQGKKIRPLRDGLACLYRLLKVRFT